MGKRRWLTIAKASCASSHSSSWWSCDIVIIAHSLKWRSWGSWALNREFKVTSVPVEGFVVVQLLSCVWLSVAPWTAAHQASPSFTIFQAVTVWVCSDSWPLSQWCHPAIWFSVTPFSSFPQSFPASGSFPVSQLFAKVLELQLQSFQWIFRVISFRMDWLDLLDV